MATMPSITFQPTVRYSSRSPRSRRRPRSALAVVSYKARLAAKPPLLRIAERHHPLHVWPVSSRRRTTGRSCSVAIGIGNNRGSTGALDCNIR